MVMFAATAATFVSAEELLDLLRRSIMYVLDRADEVKVFACQRVVEVQDDNFFLDLYDTTTDDLPVGRVQRQGSALDDKSIELTFAIEEDLTGEFLDRFVYGLTVGFFALEDEVKLVPSL